MADIEWRGREQEERPDTCPKCGREGEFRFTKFYRICKCGDTISRKSPRKEKTLKGVKGLIKALYGGKK